VLNFIDNRLQFFEPDLSYNYKLLDQLLDQRLLGMKKWSYIAASIGVISIFFACLGLVGLASQAAQMRTKEIGIRKAHGASAVQIIRSLLTDFMRLIFIAILITFPAFYAIDKILTKYDIIPSANTVLEPYTYIVAGLLALFAGLAAVISQTIKVARANPVEALRYE